MKALLIALTLLPGISLAENCDLHRFKWECDMPAKTKPTKNTAITYCGDTYVYLTQHQRNILNEYRRANINAVLKIDGQYIDSPCK